MLEEALGASGIANNGHLTLITSIVAANFQGEGLTNSGTMLITHSTIDGNASFGVGGLTNSGTVTITHSTITRNFSAVQGGGIFNFNGGALTIANSAIVDN